MKVNEEKKERKKEFILFNQSIMIYYNLNKQDILLVNLVLR